VSYSVNLKESKYFFKEIKYCPNIPYFKLTDIESKLSELVIDFEMLQKQFFLIHCTSLVIFKCWNTTLL